MQKNVASQKWVVFAFGGAGHASEGQPITGDALNITANLYLDGSGTPNAVDDTNPTELGVGYYVFDITAAESNAESIVIAPVSGTALVEVIGVPGAVYTTPANFPDTTITASTGRVDVGSVSGTSQTAGDLQALIVTADAAIDAVQTSVNTAQADLDIITGATGVNLLAATQASIDAIEADTSTDGVVIAGAQTVATVTDVTNQVTANVTAISGDTTAADNLEASMETLVTGTATGSLTTTTMADSALTEATDDHYIGRILLWRTGVLTGQATDITDYDGTGKVLTFTAVTEAPGSGDAYVIV